MTLLPGLAVAVDVINYLLFDGFCRSVLRNKKPVWSFVTGMALLGLVVPQLCYGLPGSVSFPIALVSFGIYLWVFFEGTHKEKLIAYCMSYIMVNLGQMTALMVLGLLNSELATLNAYTLTMSTLISFALLFMVSRTWKSIRFVMSNYRFLAFFLLPLSQWAIVMVSVYCLSKMTENNYMLDASQHQLLGAMFCGAVFLALIADGIFIRSMERVTQDAQEKERLAMLEKKNELSYEYIKNMESGIEEMHRFRHDFTNMLTNIQLSVESGTPEAADTALGLLRQMTNEIGRFTVNRYCECSLVNCLLSHEERKMQRENISCELRAEIPEKLGVCELELCRVLNNLFDNARECCAKMPESDRLISSNLRVCDGYLYIVVRNTRPPGKLSVKSDKEDRGTHGLGLSIIRRIAQNNGGEVIISDEGDAVTVTVTLAWSPEKNQH